MTIEVLQILVAVDFSEHAKPVIDWGTHLAEEHGSRLILLHAYHLPVEFQQLEGAYLPQEFWTNVKLEAQQQLAKYSEEISRQNVDLIVIGTRGLSGLKHLLLGSIAKRVVQKAPCPVLTVKLPEQPEG